MLKIICHTLCAIVVSVWASSTVANVEHVNYADYQVEIIVFSNLSFSNSSAANKSSNKEFFYNHNSSELNNSGMINFYDQKTQVKLLLNEYNKLKKSSQYKIITYAANRYRILPSQKSKKFLIKPSSSLPLTAEEDYSNANNKQTLDPFIGTLVITPVRNVFNLAFDAIFSEFRLTKSMKIKAKEVCYFDHPAFGALITLAEIKDRN